MAEFVESNTRKVSCPYCHEQKVVKNGRNADGKQTYRCKLCGKRFLHTGQVAGHRVPADQIGAAIGMYYGGTSYKQTGKTLTEAYDIAEPSKRTLYGWVSEYTDVARDVMADFAAHTSGKWVADEIQVKVRGESHWLWNVMDAGTRYALAVHLSPNRDTRVAVAVMRKAMAAAPVPARSALAETSRPDCEPCEREVLTRWTWCGSAALRALPTLNGPSGGCWRESARPALPWPASGLCLRR